MATISNTPRPGYVWDSADNVWYPIGVGAHQHTNAADTPAVMPYSTYAAAGKNKFLNGDFNINQRAFTSTTTDNIYMFDRWKNRSIDGTSTWSAQTFTPGAAPVSGYEATNYLQVITTGQTLSTARTVLRQHIEDVRVLAGQTVTVSFWAKAATGTPSVAFAFVQSPNGSADATSVFGKVAITTSWARYSLTASVASLSGITIGSNSSSYLDLYFSAGTSHSTSSSSLGIQSNTFSVWGMQVEAGSNVTAFQTATGNPQAELAACQRYYWRSAGGSTYTVSGFGFCNSSTTAYIGVNLPVAMRTAPASVDFSAQNLNDAAANYSVTGLGLTSTWKATTMVMLEVTVASGLTTNRPIFLTNNNNAAGYVGLSAEL
jgi:hypothetical protein